MSVRGRVVPPQIHMLEFQPPMPCNVTTPGESAFMTVIRLCGAGGLWP